jgi:hypothetical protein
MKGIALAPMIALLAACGCCNNQSDAVFIQTSYKPMVVATPVYYEPDSVVNNDPIDVTTTTIDYY